MQEIKQRVGLLPCPFCGGIPKIQKGEESRYNYIQCMNEDCCVNVETYWEPKKRDVIKSWNTRASTGQNEREAKLIALIESMKEKLPIEFQKVLNDNLSELLVRW